MSTTATTSIEQVSIYNRARLVTSTLKIRNSIPFVENNRDSLRPPFVQSRPTIHSNHCTSPLRLLNVLLILFFLGIVEHFHLLHSSWQSS
jgi:hypothetical protein